jgi:hypothetical protein
VPYPDLYPDLYPVDNWPVITVEAQFTAGTWTDISAWLDFSGGNRAVITRGANRVESPVIRYDTGTATIPLDNTDRRFDPANLSGPYVAAGKSQILPMVPVRVSASMSALTRLFTGTADAWTIGYAPPSDSQASIQASDGFKLLAIQPRSGRTVYKGHGEDSGARVNRILDDVSWPGVRSVTKGDATLQPTILGFAALTVTGVLQANASYSGPWPVVIIPAAASPPIAVPAATATSTPLDELYLTADTEMGELYVNGAGTLVFRHRNGIYLDTRSKTSQATFGDNPATELPYADVTIATDDSTLWNRATIANTGGRIWLAEDIASEVQFQPHVFDSENLIADTDWQAANYASHIIVTSAQPELRFSEISIDPLASPQALFDQILSREIGDRITITRRPPGGGSAITRDVFIRGIRHEFNESAWLTTWTLQDATSLPQPFILGDATNGILGTSKLGF